MVLSRDSGGGLDNFELKFSLLGEFINLVQILLLLFDLHYYLL